MKTCIRWAFILSAPFWLAAPTRSQYLGNPAAVEGFVVDQSGGHFLQQGTVAAHLGLVFGVR